jgi:hypothetical protein
MAASVVGRSVAMKLAATNTIKVVKLVVLFIILPFCSKKDTSDHPRRLLQGGRKRDVVAGE